jgi:hypothetical protein
MSDPRIAATLRKQNLGRMLEPTIRSAYPFWGLDTAADVFTRPNHYALDWRRIKTVFPIEDMIWRMMSPPLGRKCRCSIRPFAWSDIQTYNLTIGSGEDWYGKIVELELPGPAGKTMPRVSIRIVKDADLP